MAMKVMKAVKAMKVMKVMKASKAQKMGRAGSVAQEQKQKPKLWKALGCPRLGSVAMQDPRKPTDSELEAIREKNQHCANTRSPNCATFSPRRRRNVHH
jgi:hypothetical protein